MTFSRDPPGSALRARRRVAAKRRSSLSLLPAPAAATAAVAATTTAAAAVAAAATATAPVLARPGLVDGEVTAAGELAVQGGDGRLRLLVRLHLHEAEPFRAPGVTVHDDLGRLHGPVGREHLLQVAVGHAIIQISDVQSLAHLGLRTREQKGALPPATGRAAPQLTTLLWTGEG